MQTGNGAVAAGGSGGEKRAMPPSLYRFVWTVSGWNQAGLAALSATLFLLGIVPVELSRRIVNAAADRKSFDLIVTLTLLYLLCALMEGLMKLALNMYRSRIGERSVRWLRRAVFASAGGLATAEGTEIAIVVAEAEPVGEFVGIAISEPLLQGGILTVVGGYLLYLQPLMAVVVLLVFFPQFGFVPLMQSAISRRVQGKIGVTRRMSEGIVEQGGAIDTNGIQSERIDRIYALNMEIYKFKFSMNFLINLLAQIGYAGIFGVGSYLVINGQTEIGTIAAFVAGLGKINDPWGDFVDWYRGLKITEVKYEMLLTASSRALPDQPVSAFSNG